MAKEAAQQGEVHLPATSQKDPVSRQLLSFPRPEETQRLSEPTGLRTCPHMFLSIPVKVDVCTYSTVLNPHQQIASLCSCNLLLHFLPQESYLFASDLSFCVLKPRCYKMLPPRCLPWFWSLVPAPPTYLFSVKRTSLNFTISHLISLHLIHTL